VPVDRLAVAEFESLRAEPLGDDVLVEGHVHRAG
jgi:hypothetical protein